MGGDPRQQLHGAGLVAADAVHRPAAAVADDGQRRGRGVAGELTGHQLQVVAPVVQQHADAGEPLQHAGEGGVVQAVPAPEEEGDGDGQLSQGAVQQLVEYVLRGLAPLLQPNEQGRARALEQVGRFPAI